MDSSTNASATLIQVQAGAGSADLQSLINSAPAGATIQLAAGGYALDAPLTIDRDDIAILGAGSGQTVLTVDHAGGWTGNAITVAGNRSWAPIRTTADAALGDQALKLAGGHGISAGDWLWIEAENTPALIEAVGGSAWTGDNPLRTSLVKVSAVNGDGVTLEGGVHFDFPQGETAIYKVDPASNVTLAGFSIRYSHGTATPGSYTNTLPEYTGDRAIAVQLSEDTTLSDIVVRDAVSGAFLFKRSSGVVASDLHADGAHNKGGGGNGYGFELKAVYDSGFTGLSDRGMRHSLVFGSHYSSAGNTVEIESTDRDVNFHGGLDHHNTVLVHSSIRTADVDGMSPTLWINTGGQSFGVPTDMADNVVGFEYVVGSKRADLILGTAGGDHLDGWGGSDSVLGLGGDDTLVGGTGDSWGDDTLIGGSGYDTAILSGVPTDYTIVLGATANQAWFDDHLLDGIEAVQFQGDGSVMLLAADIAGYVADTLQPSPPANVLVGTGGADLYRVTDGSIEIVEAAGGGWDTVESWVDFTLGDNLEKLELLGDAVVGNGNGLRNVLLGNAGDNVLRGKGGDDSLYGRGGADRLYGASGDDLLAGGGGDDVLMGGGGADTLHGGSGADRFQFTAWDLGKLQLVDDFDFAEGDRLDLTRVDANAAMPGDQVFFYIGGQGFSGWAGELRLVAGLLEGDVDGDGHGDLLVRLPDNAWVPGDGFLL